MDDNSTNLLSEFDYTDNDFQFIKKMIKSKAGIDLSDNKKSLVYNRLSSRIRKLKFTSFKEYCDLLLLNTPDENEYFINAISTNLTSFFREPHHFKTLSNLILPKFKDNNSIKIWCSASSTGEEPYSIIMTCLDFHASMKQKVHLMASDINTTVLKKAEEGVYLLDSVKQVNSVTLKKYFKKGSGANSDYCKINDDLKKMIDFRQINLLEDWGINEKFDLIFCRNVIIYFDDDTQERLFTRFKQVLKPGGFLILGHSEIIPDHVSGYKLIDKTTYQLLS